MSLAKSASKLPAHARLTRCFFNFATSDFVSRYFSARKGQSKRLTFVSMIPGARELAANEDPSAKIDAAAAAETERCRKARRFISFMATSHFNWHSLLFEDRPGDSTQVSTQD